MKKLMILSVVALLASGSYVMADDDGGSSDRHKNADKKFEKMFDRQDLNGDGAVSKKEFLAVAKKRFERLDLDGNGEVTKSEARKARKKMREKVKEYHEKHRDYGDDED